MYNCSIAEYQAMSESERTEFLGEGMFFAYVGYYSSANIYNGSKRVIERVRLLPNGFDVINPTDNCIYRSGQWEAV